MLHVNATTAMFPGTSVRDALARIAAGAREPLLGDIATNHVQLCPQNVGYLSERECESLAAAYPKMHLRLHANARVLPSHRMLDASTLSDETRPYFDALADRSRRLGAKAYSLHAGHQAHSSLTKMLDAARRLQEHFGDIVVAVEGLYPNRRHPQLMDCWADYETVWRAGVPMAIDLSHLKIVADAERSCDHGLVRDLLSAATTVEVHLSDNDGRSDQHQVLSETPWWWSCTDAIHENAVVFTEGNQLRAHEAHQTLLAAR